ncbi:TPA: hypothetical protein I8Z27_003171 [Legionella pneumophila]|nr:hypothetical protein [Legionella pneumophila]MCW8434004.1 hypothetical protein [Legionella pneumophila]MDW8959211.1 hypothetical protein [Legionella pneumophila]MDW9009266.1 hypothetical protein [Legionella pneumophila]WAI65869.1 hypothetical protein OXA89_07290 [Legionella pneumophila]WAI68858.1 hypothetical protein OXA87_07290 [Legionella pneumophila]
MIIYYKKSLQEVLDAACNDYHLYMMNEQSLYARYDMDHGDIVWRR